MSILEQARKALALAAEARSAIAAVTAAAADSAAALSTTDKAELDRMLAHERDQTRAAHDELNEALDKAALRG